LANNGLNDLFEYGLEFTTGLALSDGKDKKNSTEQEQQKSFSEKYREQLKKDIDLDDDDLDLSLFGDDDTAGTNKTSGEPSMMGESEPDA
jgi:hypothetical protein